MSVNDSKRAWDGNERVSTPLTKAVEENERLQEENEKLQQENAELKERLEAMTENFRKKAKRLRETGIHISRGGFGSRADEG